VNPRLSALASAALLALAAAGCDLPRDAEGTLDRVRGGTLRVGVVNHPPWVVDSGGAVGGVESALVTQLARELGVHKSTAFRLVAALERRELVEQNADRGKYRLGTGILRLAGATTSRLDLVQESRAVSRALAQRSGETVNLAVLSDGAALYMDQVAGSSALQPHNWVGQRIPLHATSNGKVLLSGLDRADIARQVPILRAYTANTITSFDALIRELDEVRQRGYAIAIDELEIGLTAVAAPVRNVHGEVIASMSISGPTFRLDARRMPQMSEAVMDSADQVSRRLGWRG
jgi:DNA-binding IclR family transcriptional regulator